MSWITSGVVMGIPPLCWLLCPRQQRGEVVVHTRAIEVGGHTATFEGAAQVVYTVRLTGQPLNNGEDEILRFIERVKNLILCDGDHRRSRDTALHFEEAQVASARITALDIIAQFLILTVRRLIAELAFYIHDNGTGPGSHSLRV